MTTIPPGGEHVIPANPRRTRLAVTAREPVYLTAPENFEGEVALIAPGEAFTFGDGTPVPLGRVVLQNHEKRSARVEIEETSR